LEKGGGPGKKISDENFGLHLLKNHGGGKRGGMKNKDKGRKETPWQDFEKKTLEKKKREPDR